MLKIEPSFRTIGLDLIPVNTMSSPTGQLMYMHYKYGGKGFIMNKQYYLNFDIENNNFRIGYDLFNENTNEEEFNTLSLYKFQNISLIKFSDGINITNPTFKSIKYIIDNFINIEYMKITESDYHLEEIYLKNGIIHNINGYAMITHDHLNEKLYFLNGYLTEEIQWIESPERIRELRKKLEIL
jgi:hypothetical protein